MKIYAITKRVYNKRAFLRFTIYSWMRPVMKAVKAGAYTERV